VSPALRAESGTTTTTTTTERERTERMKGITPTRINLQRRYTTNSSRSLVSFSFFFYGGTTKLCTGKKKPVEESKNEKKKSKLNCRSLKSPISYCRTNSPIVDRWPQAKTSRQ
jgi:hypothetical protein